MKENVGHFDRVLRAFLGSVLLSVGVTGLGAMRGRIPGLATMIAGILTIESAITRVCPTNYLAGVDTSEIEEELIGGASRS